MGTSRLLIIFSSSVLILLLATLTLSDQDDPYFVCEYAKEKKGNFTANSTYEANLKRIVSQLSSVEEFNYGFHNLSVGEGQEKVFAIALCRGDQTPNQCRKCFNYTATKLFVDCPWGKEVAAWSEFCMLRYANRDIFGQLDNDPRKCESNPTRASNVEDYNLALFSMLNNLSSIATKGGPLRKFAFGDTNAAFQVIHVLVQCTPDLNEQNCSTCLNSGISELRNCCSGRIGCRALRPSCTLRFEIGPFYNQTPIPLPSPPSSLTPSSTTSKGKNNNTTRTVIIVLASVLGILILIVLSTCIFLRRTKTPEMVETADEITKAESLQFDFKSVVNATNNFSDANKLGQGGFGVVYMGQLSNGQKIAVKRLSVDSGQGDPEFKNEVLLVAKLEHRNLVRLLGFCLEGQERLLIYEFVPNRSLNNFIFDSIKRAQLDWKIRYKIIGGIARGLLYLHEDSRFRIIHRDLKPSNILLDAEMSPKIADFGMARLFGQDETQGNTSKVVGTYGYMAPEYISHGQISVKTDVFSFGVLLLEIISGQRSNHAHQGQEENNLYLLNLAWKNWRDGTVWKIIDTTLGDGSRIEIARCIHIGLLCVQENVANRPTMASVILMMNSFSTTLPMPTQPAFAMQPNNIESDDSNPSKNEPLSQNEVTITELTPR